MSAALTDFVALAESFCRAAANVDRRPPESQLAALHVLLPELYAAALRLPEGATSSSHEELESPPRVRASQGAAVAVPAGLHHLAEFLGTRRFYREVFDPYAEAGDGEVTGDLIDDFSDIYTDLERGLVEWRAGARSEALWQWRFHFQVHWGEHATSALRALFALSAWRGAPWPAGGR